MRMASLTSSYRGRFLSLIQIEKKSVDERENSFCQVSRHRVSKNERTRRTTSLFQTCCIHTHTDRYAGSHDIAYLMMWWARLLWWKRSVLVADVVDVKLLATTMAWYYIVSRWPFRTSISVSVGRDRSPPAFWLEIAELIDEPREQSLDDAWPLLIMNVPGRQKL